MIQIEQAYFGERNNQHQLICSSFTDEELLNHLIPLSDKPAGLVSIQPYISGYYFNNYYVFTYTIADTIAQRQGLVFSHCLIIQKTDISKINNLSPIFEAFVTKPEKEVQTIDSLKIDEDEFNKPIGVPIPNAYASVIKLLLKDKTTVLWPQYDDFHIIIRCLWFAFLPSIRENFKFCLCDNPNFIIDRNYTIAYTPSQNISKWTNHKIAELETTEELNTVEELFFVDSNNKKFKEFIDLLEINVTHPHDLNKVSEAYTLYSEFTKNKSPLYYNILIRKVGVIAPNPNQARKIKEEIFETFSYSIQSSDIDTILSIRSINLDPYLYGVKEIAQSLSKWCTANFMSIESDLKDWSNLFSEFFENKNPNWWQIEIEKALKSNFANIHSRNINQLLNIWSEDNKLVLLMSKYIERTVVNEAILIDNINKVSHFSLIPNLIQLSKINEWVELHAICVYFQFNEKEAVKKQIIFEGRLHSDKGLYRIISKIGETRFLEISLELNEDLLHTTAGKLCAKKPSYLIGIDIENFNWQKVWYNSILVTQNIESGLVNPQQLIYSFFDLIVSDRKYLREILPIIADSKFGGIYHYNQRQLLWNKLNVALEQFLEKTSIQVIQEIFSLNMTSLEKELIDYLKSTHCQSLIYASDSLPVSNRIKYFDLIEKLNENRLIDILKNKVSLIKTSDSEYIGRTINQNSWENAADLIFNLKYRNSALDIALNYCRTLLTWYKKIITPNITHNFMSKTTSATGKPKVFISYNHKDKSYATKINDKLKSEGFDVIIDEEAMTTGQKIEEFIRKSISESAVTLSIVSENSLLSAWVAMETINSTIGNIVWGRTFMPCKIDDKIFDRKFPTEGIKKIELEITEINELIRERMNMNSDFSYLSTEHARFTKLKNELPSIIGTFKSSFCTDLSDTNFDTGMNKVIEDLNKISSI